MSATISVDYFAEDDVKIESSNGGTYYTLKLRDGFSINGVMIFVDKKNAKSFCKKMQKAIDSMM